MPRRASSARVSDARDGREIRRPWYPPRRALRMIALTVALSDQTWPWFKVFVGVPGGTLMIAAVSAWRFPKLPLECAMESRLRFVSDVCRDFRDAPRRTFERPCGQLKP